MDEDEGPIEIAITGDLTDHEGELTERILGVDPGEACTLYFDSPGGSPYCAMSLMTLIKMRRLRATGIITGECSSAALWPYAACERRIVTPYSVLLFHPMRWQSEENVGLAEAAEWARHFGDLERSMDDLLAQMFGAPSELMAEWINPGRYVSGRGNGRRRAGRDGRVQRPAKPAPRRHARTPRDSRINRRGTQQRPTTGRRCKARQLSTANDAQQPTSHASPENHRTRTPSRDESGEA